MILAHVLGQWHPIFKTIQNPETFEFGVMVSKETAQPIPELTPGIDKPTGPGGAYMDLGPGVPISS